MQAGVDAFSPKQRFMSALLGNACAFQYYDLVGVLDGR
jgi:hypothetical protein